MRARFPDSEICGSTGIRPSPQLIAAYYVLHRLCVPRHPPDALALTLDRSAYVPCPERRPVHERLRTPEHSFENGIMRSVFKCRIEASPIVQSVNPAFTISSFLRDQATRNARLLSRSSDCFCRVRLLSLIWWSQSGSNR